MKAQASSACALQFRRRVFRELTPYGRDNVSKSLLDPSFVKTNLLVHKTYTDTRKGPAADTR